MTNKVSRLFYTSVKEYTEKHGSQEFKTRQQLDKICFIYCFLRMTIGVLELASGYFCEMFLRERLFAHDYIMYFFKRQEENAAYNSLFALQAVPIAVFNYYSLHLLYKAGAPEKIVLKKFYFYVVENADHFNQWRRSVEEIKTLKSRQYRKLIDTTSLAQVDGDYTLKTCFSLLKNCIFTCFAKVRVNILFYAKLEHFNLQKVEKKTRVNSYFDIPFPLRVALYRNVALFDFLMFAFQSFVFAIYVFMFFLFLIYFYPIYTKNYLYLVWILLDFAMIIYSFNTLIQTGLVFAYFSVVAALMFRWKIKYALNNLKIVKNKAKNFKRYLSAVEYFLREHHLMNLDIMTGNEQLWSRVLFAFLLTNSLPNVYLCTRLAFDTLTYTEQVITWTVFLGQSAASVISSIPCAAFSAALHAPSKVLVLVQSRLQAGSKDRLLFSYKLKLDDLLKRLLIGQTYGVTVGPLGVVTYSNLFQVFLVAKLLKNLIFSLLF